MAYSPRLRGRTGVVGYGAEARQWHWLRKSGQQPDQEAAGQVFKKAGYKTALIGDIYHGLRPMSQGFDLTYFIDKSNNPGTDKLKKQKKKELFGLSEERRGRSIRS